MKYPIISVIIPVYNVSKYIVNCVESVLKQDYQGFIEIIVVDDCGDDDSIEKVKKIKDISNSPNREINILYNKKNLGLSASRNNGLRYSNGEYVFFLDSDDYISTDALRIMYHKIINEGSDFVYGNISHVVNTIPEENKTQIYIQNRVIENKKDIILGLFNTWPPVAWNKLFKKKFLTDNHLFFYEGIVYEDLFWSFQISLCCMKISYINQTTYFYTVRNDSISKTFSLHHYESLLTMVKLFYNSIIDKIDLFKEYKDEIVSKYESMRILAINFIYENSFIHMKEGLKILQSYNIVPYYGIVVNKNIPLKNKIKILQFYIGSLGDVFIKFRQRIHK